MSPRAFVLLQLALVSAIACWHVVPHRGLDFGWSLLVHGLATGAWLSLVIGVLRGSWRPTFAHAFGLALVLRAIAVPLGPELSDDVHRYLWEGRLVLEGVNPYVSAPDDPSLAHLRDANWGRINNRAIPAAYPPAVQYALVLGVAIDDAPWAMGLVFGAFDLTTFVLLWLLLAALGLPSERAVVYGLCPLVVLEFAGEAHSDSLAACFLVAALLAVMRGRSVAAGSLLAVTRGRSVAAGSLRAVTRGSCVAAGSLRAVTRGSCVAAGALRAVVRGRGIAAGALLGVSAASKLWPGAMLPFVARGSRWAWASFAVIAILLWSSFVPIDDPGAVFAGTAEYAARWHFNDTLFAAIHGLTRWGGERLFGATVSAGGVARVLVALLGVGWVGFMYVRRWPPHRAALGFAVFFCAFAPTVHPWYVAGVLVPLLPLWPNLGLCLFTGTVFLAYHVLPGWLTDRVWVESGWVKALAWAPFYLGLLGAAFVRRRRTEAGGVA